MRCSDVRSNSNGGGSREIFCVTRSTIGPAGWVVAACAPSALHDLLGERALAETVGAALLRVGRRDPPRDERVGAAGGATAAAKVPRTSQ